MTQEFLNCLLVYFVHDELMPTNVEVLRFPGFHVRSQAFLDVEVVRNGHEADDVKSRTLVLADMADDSKEKLACLEVGTRVCVERESLFDDHEGSFFESSALDVGSSTTGSVIGSFAGRVLVQLDGATAAILVSLTSCTAIAEEPTDKTQNNKPKETYTETYDDVDKDDDDAGEEGIENGGEEEVDDAVADQSTAMTLESLSVSDASITAANNGQVIRVSGLLTKLGAETDGAATIQSGKTGTAKSQKDNRNKAARRFNNIPVEQLRSRRKLSVGDMVRVKLESQDHQEAADKEPEQPFGDVVGTVVGTLNDALFLVLLDVKDYPIAVAAERCEIYHTCKEHCDKPTTTGPDFKSATTVKDALRASGRSQKREKNPLLFVSPKWEGGREVLTLPKTPSDVRAFKNALALMNRRDYAQHPSNKTQKTTAVTRKCHLCNQPKEEVEYSRSQWKKACDIKCRTCLEEEAVGR